jgi:5'-nucleotidase
MKRPLVLLDCDGILFDFVGAFLGKIEEQHGIHYDRDSVTEFDFSNLPDWNKGFWGLCQLGGFASTPGCIFPGAVEGVNALREIADVEVCTSPYKGSLTWVGERDLWLKQYFNFSPSDVHYTHKKHLMRADYLVDDRAENAEQFPGTGVLWTRSYNRHSGHPVRVRSWDELIQVVRCKS